MKILWLSVTPALYDEQKVGGWIGSLEEALIQYGENIELGIAFEYGKDTLFSEVRNGVTYFPICVEKNKKDHFIYELYPEKRWQKIREHLLKILDAYNPDIVQCFGTEWPFGLIAKDSNIPIVIHMQGFINIYDYHENWVRKLMGIELNPKERIRTIFRNKDMSNREANEQQIMKLNRYYLGRTKWDERIVQSYNPNAKYFYCPEVIRPAIYKAKQKWEFEKQDPVRIVTITQAGPLKGNEIILQTAKLLKEQFHFNIEWRVAGNPSFLLSLEQKLEIRHEEYGIKLLGMIPKEEIVKELSSAQMYVHPSIIDNSPNSLCEAQLIGCPVIATYVGGIPEMVHDGETGVLYPYNEIHTLAFIIMEYANNKEKLEALSRNEIEDARNRHDPKKIIDRLEEIYKLVLQDNNTLRVQKN